MSGACRAWQSQLQSKHQAKVDEATEATEAAAAWLTQLRRLQEAEVLPCCGALLTACKCSLQPTTTKALSHLLAAC